MMTPSLRRIALTAHVTLSVGWIGSVIAFLALVLMAMTGDDARLRAAWIAMETIGWLTIVPFALTSLLTGIIMGLGTKWGLFRHYWVVISLALTTFATTILVLNMRTVTLFAALAAGTENASIEPLRSGLWSELLHAGVGLLVLLAIEVLNVYKPRGMTPYGRRVELRASADAERGMERRLDAPEPQWRWPRVLAIVIVALILLVLGLHHSARGLGGLH